MKICIGNIILDPWVNISSASEDYNFSWRRNNSPNSLTFDYIAIYYLHHEGKYFEVEFGNDFNQRIVSIFQENYLKDFKFIEAKSLPEAQQHIDNILLKISKLMVFL